MCPAGITVLKGNGAVNVRFRKTHIGHDVDLGHLNLTLAERQSLAEKLAAKIPFDAILDDVRNSISETGRERLHLLKKKMFIYYTEKFQTWIRYNETRK